MKKYKIAVAGTGYVGLSIATLLSQHHHVTAVDIVPEKVEMINNRKSPIQDDYIEKYLAEKDLDLTATLDAKDAYSDGWAFNMRCSAKKKAMYTAIEKIAAPFCDKIICISDAEKQSALDKKICKEDKLALPEYMMAGKPIVASSVDAIPNIIRDGENGLLVEVDDDIGASEAVLRIYREDGLRDRLVAQGMEDVHNRFNARRVSEEHGKLFERL